MNLRDMRGALPHSKKEETQKIAVPLTTAWGEALDPAHVREEYPRPELMRADYGILNGYWDYAFTREGKRPRCFDGKILVPFSPECSLSGVNRQLQPDKFLWYERRVPVPDLAGGRRLLLHFEAVDQCAAVFVNGRKAVSHTGGYLPFTADVTDFLHPGAGFFMLTVRVQDLSDTSYHSRGKQKLAPGGMYYTAQSGIWQTVWWEIVPKNHIEELSFEAEDLLGHVRVTVAGNTEGGITLRVYEPTCSFDADSCLPWEGAPLAEYASQKKNFLIAIPDARLWSCETPWIYPVEIAMGDDRVRSYLALRIFTKEKDEKGKARLCLNGEPIFMNGILDQGYWPDGLYTAPSDEALVYDIAQMKRLGFNMLRKHAKIEARRWYYHCDRQGMIVWQDMVNGGGKYSALLLTYIPTGICVPGPLMKREKSGKKRAHSSLSEPLERLVTGRRNAAGREEFERECAETIRHLRNHPSIMAWVIFNEGWGQFDTVRMTESVRRLDPGRIVDSASGWFEHKTGDVKSIHNYFRKLTVPEDVRATVISEYGGYVWHLEDHSMYESTYGYHTCGSAEEFGESFRRLMEEIRALEQEGLAGAVYTQVSDIEEETNGLLTYDRKVCKV